MSNRDSDGARPSAGVTHPEDPYDGDTAVHVDELPDFNGDSKARFAFDDDGTRYKVTSGENFPATKLIPERQWRETFMPERDGVGDQCRGCGNTIEWNAVIVNSEWHLRCYPDGGEGSE